MNFDDLVIILEFDLIILIQFLNKLPLSHFASICFDKCVIEYL